MSLLSDFTAGQYLTSKGVIGATAVIIGTGDAVDVIQGEERQERASELNGFERSSRLTIVAGLADFIAVYPAAIQTYLGKNCTHKGDEWRIADIEEGAGFVTITLASRTEVS